jgi:DedD protein
VAHQTAQDDGFHEIQLNGKQLVFLFMAATVVSVVIFLCGVLVGRGVPYARSAMADASAVSTVAEPTPQRPDAPPPTPAGSDPTAAPPPTPASDEHDLTYFKRLENEKAPAEQLKPAPDRNVAPSRAAAAHESVPAPKPAPAEAKREAATTAAEPNGSGFAVQIAALNLRSEADAIARRLSTKGYAAYVLSPANGTPSVYRVRVGKFPTRREAETIAAKLQKEEQFKPWVTR